jgi:hypothetical protein
VDATCMEESPGSCRCLRGGAAAATIKLLIKQIDNRSDAMFQIDKVFESKFELFILHTYLIKIFPKDFLYLS